MKKKYTVSGFEITRDEFTLGGRMYRTKKKEQGLVPVILCHGFMSAAPLVEPYAKALRFIPLSQITIWTAPPAF